MVFVAMQPVAVTVYVIVVLPTETPRILAGDAELRPTEAILGSPESHVPPAVPSVNADAALLHTNEFPVIAAGLAFTVTVAVDVQPDAV